jgi:hypothetical protein
MRRQRYIKLVLVTDQSRSESVVKAPHVTTTMIEAARDFERVLMTGEPVSVPLADECTAALIVAAEFVLASVYCAPHENEPVADSLRKAVAVLRASVPQ